MYTFGLGRSVYSFGLGLPYATQSYEISVDSQTLNLLGHALNIEISESVHSVSPGYATLVFTGYPANVAAGADLPLDYFLDEIRIEQTLDFITIVKSIDIVTVQRELDAISITQKIDAVSIQTKLDAVRVLRDSS